MAEGDIQKPGRSSFKTRKELEVAGFKPRYVRPKLPRVMCPMCPLSTIGYRGEHEYRRHFNRIHLNSTIWVVRDRSGTGLLSKCRACSSEKQYQSDYSAVVHLRRQHFNHAKNPGLRIPDNIRNWVEKVEITWRTELVGSTPTFWIASYYPPLHDAQNSCSDGAGHGPSNIASESMGADEQKVPSQGRYKLTEADLHAPTLSDFVPMVSSAGTIYFDGMPAPQSEDAPQIGLHSHAGQFVDKESATSKDGSSTPACILFESSAPDTLDTLNTPPDHLGPTALQVYDAVEPIAAASDEVRAESKKSFSEKSMLETVQTQERHPKKRRMKEHLTKGRCRDLDLYTVMGQKSW
ncbi:hypothetical protein K440DRAFT_661151 [Wilcoxina mikolae CBS 423.85]|nr:hypothetical protein K440DRAFT_661151 [Wilcoxina mikolae CBS 423.85]